MSWEYAKRTDQLSRIARCLGQTDEQFAAAIQSESVQGATECLLLWQRITTADGRRRVLEAMRRIAAEDPGSDGEGTRPA